MRFTVKKVLSLEKVELRELTSLIGKLHLTYVAVLVALHYYQEVKLYHNFKVETYQRKTDSDSFTRL